MSDPASKEEQLVPPPSADISAIQINQAREMVRAHTRARNPTPLTTTSDIHARVATQMFLRPHGSVGTVLGKKFSPPPSSLGRSPPLSIPTAAPQTRVPSQTQAPSSQSRVCVPAKNHTGQCTNPQCAACGCVIIPLPKASFPFREQPSITVNEWSIYTAKGPICLSDELDHLNATRYDFPLPEMIFGGNSVRLIHDPTGASVGFNTLDALDSLATVADFKVAYHQEWLRTRPNASRSAEDAERRISATQSGVQGRVLQNGQSGEQGRQSAPQAAKSLAQAANCTLDPPMLDLELVKPYDWTYSTNYKGTVCNGTFVPSDKEIPVARLLRQDPILFYDESVLFEDELGDNGITMLLTKIRVMHTCLLLLCRLFMRVDDVAFRVRDTRVFVDLETNEVIREYKTQQALFDDVLRKVVGRTPDPKKLFRDSNWVGQNIPTLTQEVETMVFEAATDGQKAE